VRQYNQRMSFTATVKKTGQLFDATNEVSPSGGLGRDAHQLENGKSYMGHLFDAYPTPESTMVTFSKAEWAVFQADELQELDVPRVTLVPTRRDTAAG
jgi:hypothetical protein